MGLCKTCFHHSTGLSESEWERRSSLGSPQLSAESTLLEPSGFEAGQKFGGGRYLLVLRLGQGGMGEVWLANDLQLNKSVALKFLAERIRLDPRALKLLRDEVVLCQDLSHPNVLRIYDWKEYANEPVFLAMEYVDGGTLKDRLLEQPGGYFSWIALAPYAKQLCDGLKYAHDRKVIHRDIKPRNLLVTSRNVLKVADFGLARVTAAEPAKVFEAMRGAGTLGYMSPQQRAGEAVTVADDLYAVGATLYELLTGAPPPCPPPREPVRASTWPKAPLVRDAVGLRGPCDVPKPVQEAIAACLEYERGRRPGNIYQLAQRLGLEHSDWEDAPIVELRAPPPASKWLPRLKIAALIGISFVVIALVGSFVLEQFGTQRKVPPPEPKGRPPQLAETKTRTNAQPFSPTFLMQPVGGGRELFTNGDLFVILQGPEGAYTNGADDSGKVFFKELPAAWEGQEVQVSVNGRHWRLADDTNRIRLSREPTPLNVERRDVVLHGTVSTASNGVAVALANVEVSAAGVATASDAQGRFALTIAGRSVRDSMLLTAKLEGYQPYGRSLTNLAEEQALTLAALPPPPFTQGFLLVRNAATNFLLPGSEAMVLECEGKTYREAVSDEGEAKFENLPALMKGREAKVSVSSPNWQLPKDASTVWLTGQTLSLALERRDIVVRGSVSARDTKTPLAGALVAVAGVSAVTDRDGLFNITVPGRSLGGPLELRVKREEYQPFNEEIAHLDKDQIVSLEPAPKVPPPVVAPTNLVAAPVEPPATNPPAPSAPPEAKSLTDIATYPPMDAWTTNATRAMRAGKMKLADELLRKAVSGYEHLTQTNLAKFGSALADAHLLRAQLFAQTGDDAKSRSAYEEAKTLSAKLGADNKYLVGLADKFNSFALSLSELGDSRQNRRVIEGYQQAIGLCRRAMPAFPNQAHEIMALAYWNLGSQYEEMVDYANASAAFGEAATLYERLAPSQVPEAAFDRVKALGSLAGAQAKAGKSALARTNYLAAIQACTGLNALNPLEHERTVAELQGNYGRFLLGVDDFPKARSACEEAIKHYRKLETDRNWTDRSSFANTLNNYGVVLMSLDRKNNALAADLAYREALELSRRARDRELELRVLRNQGLSLQHQGRLSQARDKFSEGLRIGERYLDQPSVGIRANLADLHLLLAELEARDSSSNPPQQVARLRTARNHLAEAEKLIAKLPAAADKSQLQGHARELKATLATTSLR